MLELRMERSKQQAELGIDGIQLIQLLLYHSVVGHLSLQATLSHLMVDLPSESYMGKPQGKGT